MNGDRHVGDAGLINTKRDRMRYTQCRKRRLTMSEHLLTPEEKCKGCPDVKMLRQKLEEEHNRLKELRQTIPEKIKKAKLEVIEEACKVYDKYVKALENENGSLVGLAYIHGWRSNQVQFGENCRNAIQQLKSKYGVEK